MLLAAAAFVQQGAMIAMSQAAAAAGFMLHPAVILHGALHFHDHLAGHVHAHGGDQAPGHVHGSADPDDDHADGIGKMPLWSLGGITAITAAAELYAGIVPNAGAIEHLPDNLLRGVEPDGLSRPPSIPSIA